MLPQRATLRHSWLPKRFPDKAWNGQCGPVCLLRPGSSMEPMFIFSRSLHCPSTLPVMCKTPSSFRFVPSTCKVSHTLYSMPTFCSCFCSLGKHSPPRAYTPLQPCHPSSLTPSIHDSNQICEAFSHMLICLVVCFKPHSPNRTVSSQRPCVT